MTIMINDILRIEDPSKYKLHLACEDEDGNIPLDDYVRSPLEWCEWNEYKSNVIDWTREYVFSFMEFYPKKDSWLFGGVFEVLDRTGDHYKLDTVADFEKYTGRLLVSFRRPQGAMGRAFYLETYLDQFVVKELRAQPYTGEDFPGYEKINHDFSVMEEIFTNEREGWKAALSKMKGVYLICNKDGGKKYVGSAYGEEGIWSRWANYIETGHGWNEGLAREIDEEGKGIEYARKNYKFSLLEIMSVDKSDDFIRERETYWKEVLLTREFGYNEN